MFPCRVLVNWLLGPDLKSLACIIFTCFLLFLKLVILFLYISKVILLPLSPQQTPYPTEEGFCEGTLPPLPPHHFSIPLHWGIQPPQD